MKKQKNKFSRKEEREAVLNNAQSKILGLFQIPEVMDAFKKVFELHEYYETTISDLRKTMYSHEFLKKRIHKLYPADQKFTQFITHLTEG